MPLVIFGDGLRNKDHLKFKGLRTGVSNKLYNRLKLRESLGELLLLDIHEYNTSKVCKTAIICSIIVVFISFIFRRVIHVSKQGLNI